MILSRTPLGRLGDVDEVARIALFLATDDSSYITGQTIYCDGGRMALNYEGAGGKLGPGGPRSRPRAIPTNQEPL